MILHQMWQGICTCPNCTADRVLRWMEKTGNSLREVHVLAQRGGKTAAMERAMAEYTRKNPDAVVARYIKGQLIIEKPVKAEIVLPYPQLKGPNETQDKGSAKAKPRRKGEADRLGRRDWSGLRRKGPKKARSE